MDETKDNQQKIKEEKTWQSKTSTKVLVIIGLLLLIGIICYLGRGSINSETSQLNQANSKLMIPLYKQSNLINQNTSLAGINYTYAYNGLYNFYLTNNSNMAKSARFEYQGYSFVFDTTQSQAQWYNSNTKAISGGILNPQNTILETNGNTATYLAGGGAANLTYTLSGNSLKENIVIPISLIPNNVSNADFFRYKVNIYYNNSLSTCVNNNCSTHASNYNINTQGSITFQDSNGDTITTIPPPIITDNDGSTYLGTWFLTLNNGVDSWYLGVPATLKQTIPNATISIDPTFNIPSLPAGGSYDLNVTTYSNNATALNPNNIAPYDSLVGYWTFDQDSATTAFDLSNKHNNGTYTSGAYTSPSCGLYGNGACFNGVTTGQFISVSNSNSLNFNNFTSFSISSWFKAGSARSQLRAIVNKFSSGPQYALYLTGTGALRGEVADGLFDNTITSSSAYDDGNWHYAVFIRDTTTHNLSLYVDGASVATQVADQTGDLTNPIVLSIGNFGAASVRVWNGSIDDLMIFNSTLTPTQISAIYNNQSQRFYPIGTHTLPQIHLTGGNYTDNTVNVSVGFETNLGTNISIRVGTWNITNGYNDISNSIAGDLNNGLVAYYHADNVTGNGNVVTGKVGNALSFNGVNNMVSLGNASTLSLSGNYSISLWFNTSYQSGYQDILNKFSSTGNMNYYMFVQAGFLKFESNINGTTSQILSSPKILSNNTWYNAVIVYNGTNENLYLNGYLNNSLVKNGTVMTNNIVATIGGHYTGIESFNGSIDEVRLWNRPLSSAEIATMYGNESTGQTDPNMNRTGLAGEWLFNQSFSYYLPLNSPVLDTSGNGNNGILGGMFNITDASGNGNNGLLRGGVNLLSAGQYNQSFNIDGFTGFVNVSNPARTATPKVTVSAWINTPTISLRQVIFDHQATASPYYGYTLQILNRKILWGVKASNIAENDQVGATVLNSSQWYYVTATYDGTNQNTYINGVLDATHVLGGDINYTVGTSAYMGVAQDGTSFHNNGQIDELMIYNRSLSQLEISQLYTKGRANWAYTTPQNLTENTKTFNYASSPGIVSCWLDGVTDSCGGINNGTLVGGANWTNTNRGTIGNVTLGINGSNYARASSPILSSVSLTGSLSAWFNLNTLKATNTYSGIAGNDNGNTSLNGADVYVDYGTGKIVFEVSNSTVVNKVTTTNSFASPGNWYHVVGTWNGTGVNTYVNGALISSTPQTVNVTPAYNFTIGEDGAVSSFMYTNGYIDEVAVWNRSLNASEIQQIYLGSKRHQSNNTFTMPTGTSNLLTEFTFLSNAYNFYTPWITSGIVIKGMTSFVSTICDTFATTGLCNCNENYTVTSNAVLATGSLILNGTGTLNIGSYNITNVSTLYGSIGCKVWGGNGGYIGK